MVLDLTDEHAGAIGLHCGARDLGGFMMNVALHWHHVRDAVQEALRHYDVGIEGQ